MTHPTTFYASYVSLLDQLIHESIEVNQRTGHGIRALFGGISFTIDLQRNGLPVCGVRKLFPHIAAAETAWFVSGQQDTTWLRQHTKIWDKFLEDDGSIRAAYGYRWRRHFKRDQLALAIQALQKDPSDRRVLVSAWDPATDGLGSLGQKNVPCPAAFTLSITHGCLHSALFIRSSDVFMGLPYDVMGHTLLMQLIAHDLKVSLGTMTVTLAHAHLYEIHHASAVTALENTDDHKSVGPLLPTEWGIKDVEDFPNAYVKAVKNSLQRVWWPTFSPKLDVVV